MVDTPSDISSAGSAIPKPSHISIQTPSQDLEKGNDTNNNGYLFTGERKHSRAEKDDDEEEDLDMLIEELESLDPDEPIEDTMQVVGAQRMVPEELLQTDTRVGLVEPEVVQRRKKYGLNQMKEERENLLLKFLGYFVGPIQFVMEVSLDNHHFMNRLTIYGSGCCCPRCWSARLGRLRSSLCTSSAQCFSGILPRVSSWINRGRVEEDLGTEGCRLTGRAID